jgi:aminoglycoside 6-adenylyltransferase
MKRINEEEMLSTIIGFAESDERIRVVLMNGSRVNPNVSPDPFQDYDILNLVTDVAPFREYSYVVPRFGEVIAVEQPLTGPWPPEDADRSYHNYNIQLVDGNRIDISFCHLDTMGERLKDSLTKVLLDKDGRLPSLPEPDESSYLPTPPSPEMYDGCCDGFFFALSSHIPKTMWRKQLPLLKFYVDGWLREPLLMMFGWEVGIRTNWKRSIGSKGKYLERYLPPDVWERYRRTFAGYRYENLWDSLFLCLEVFEASAKFVADTFGFRYPHETAHRVLRFLEHVRSLPEDAERIY